MLKEIADGTYGPHEDGPEVSAVRARVPDDEAASRMALLASGFADPGRIRILRALTGAPVCVGDLALALGVSQSSVSHQLRLLRTLGIVTSERRGRHISYALAWSGTARVLDQLDAAVGANDTWQHPASAGADTGTGEDL